MYCVFSIMCGAQILYRYIRAIQVYDMNAEVGFSGRRKKTSGKKQREWREWGLSVLQVYDIVE